MTQADFINRINEMLPGVKYVHIYDFCDLNADVLFAHHQYGIHVDYTTDRFVVVEQFPVNQEAGSDEIPEEETSFSKRVCGLLNGYKRNEAGELVVTP